MPQYIRPVEIFIGYSNHTWDTQTIPILKETPEHKIEKVAIEIAQRLFYNNPNTKDEVAFVGVYNVPSLNEDET